ncbi:Meckel syndrome, type 1 isoform X2 [Leptinotarsa decemlineata]|uniref:Meckel syndrome, type 1 isoform X2 n=1 Tax=Leptinotarsa decemlineata TaxID=7539 RepID=UPI003D30582D
MYNTKEKLTKYTGYYRCVDEIQNFKIRIRLKEEDAENINANREDEWHIQEFCWQEKHFSKIEKDFYGDINNCFTDLEKIYNERISENQESSIFFTYVDKDGFFEDEDAVTTSYLQKYVEGMKLGEEHVEPSKVHSDYHFEQLLNSSIDKKAIQSDFERMTILADLGDYIEDIWIKNEQVLCSIKFDRVYKVVSIYPDFTKSKPYSLKIQGERPKYVHYFIEQCSENFSETEEQKEKDIMKKVVETKQSLMRDIVGNIFFVPPKNKLYVFLFFEISTARNFENDDLYLHYRIELPKYWSCGNPQTLRGTTQTCHGIKEDGLVHFGHNFDVLLEYDIESLQEKSVPDTPYIYFEIISKGTWDRYRTEGLTYKNLPVSTPGCHSYSLSCFRFDTDGPSSRLRRFFIGDGYNYEDLRRIGPPQQENQMRIFNRFAANTIGTGRLDFRLNVINQSQAFLQEFTEGSLREKHIYEKLSSSSLIKSVNQVLHAFRRARRNMIEVKKTVKDGFQ